MNTKKTVIIGLLAALTCIATMIIKIPTPTFGYIHLGDGLVLICGIMLGPTSGGLAAGIGSMFADIFSGYASFAIPTLIIKALTAFIAGFIFKKLGEKSVYFAIILGGILGELFMVLGYFLYEVFLATATAPAFTTAALTAGIAASLSGVPFNLVQGIVGIILSAILYPLLHKLYIAPRT